MTVDDPFDLDVLAQGQPKETAAVVNLLPLGLALDEGLEGHGRSSQFQATGAGHRL
jgi:hypothetical protein